MGSHSHAFTPNLCTGILHNYSSRLTAFEYTISPGIPSSPLQNTPPYKPHVLLFIGGLYDGLSTVPYVRSLAHSLSDTKWAVWHVLLSSSYTGFGCVDLDRDIKEMESCVEYVRAHKEKTSRTGRPGKIVIMGHSTGSQDVMHYISAAFAQGKDKRAFVDGAVMQAPVSDREHMRNTCVKEGTPNALDDAIRIAKEDTVDKNGDDVLMPLNVTGSFGLGNAPLTKRRFLSFADFKGQDDKFSSDLDEEFLKGTFGVVPKLQVLKGPLQVLYSGSDEYVPESVDKEMLVGRWRKIFEEAGGEWDQDAGIVPGATHSPAAGEPREELVRRVVEFLKRVQGVAQASI